MSATRFFTLFLVTSLIAVGAVAAFNVAVDPYLLFDVPRYTGFNAIKPAVKTRERLIKAYAAPRTAPRTVILGSSRCDVGLNPASQVWNATDRPVYNLSLPGTNLTQLTRLLQHVIALNSPAEAPRTAIVCLDFEFFLFRSVATPVPATSPVGPDEFEERLAVRDDGLPNRQRYLRMVTDYVNATFSLTALADSAKTLSANLLPAAWDISADGHLAETMFSRPIAVDGVADLFASENMDTIRRLSTRQVLSDMPGGAISRLPAVRRLMEIARANGMSIIFAIQPSHADLLEIFDRMGYWEDYERWKRALAELVAVEKARGTAVTLWDFSGYDAYAVERVPAGKDQATRLQWFWDSVHYTTALGDIMAARILNRQSTEPFGVELTPELVDERLARVRLDRENYRRREPGEVQRRAALFSGSSTVGQTTMEFWREDTLIQHAAYLWENAIK